MNADGFADLVLGAGTGGGPQVKVVSGQALTADATAALANPLASFYVGSPTSRAGIPVAALDLNAGGWLGAGGSLLAYSGATLGTTLSNVFNLTSAPADGTIRPGLSLVTSPPPASPPPAPGDASALVTLQLKPLDINLLGLEIDTSPIRLTIQARTGDGLVLGNVLTALANLFNPPLPDALDLDFINGKLQELITTLDTMLPDTLVPATSTPPPIPAGSDRVLQLVVPPIDLNLLTDQINVNADARTGNGLLLGNVVTTLLNTLGATPENLTALSNNINALLARVVGVLNASNLTLADGAVGALAPVLQNLSIPDPITAAPGASVPVLNLSIASTDGTTPPVDVNLLGVEITTSNINARLTATTGAGQVLGNLVYNVAHLLDPGGAPGLLGDLAL